MSQAHSHVPSFTCRLGLVHATMAKWGNRDTVQPAKLKKALYRKHQLTPECQLSYSEGTGNRKMAQTAYWKGSGNPEEIRVAVSTAPTLPKESAGTYACGDQPSLLIGDF